MNERVKRIKTYLDSRFEREFKLLEQASDPVVEANTPPLKLHQFILFRGNAVKKQLDIITAMEKMSNAIERGIFGAGLEGNTTKVAKNTLNDLLKDVKAHVEKPKGKAKATNGDE